MLSESWCRLYFHCTPHVSGFDDIKMPRHLEDWFVKDAHSCISYVVFVRLNQLSI